MKKIILMIASAMLVFGTILSCNNSGEKDHKKEQDKGHKHGNHEKHHKDGDHGKHGKDHGHPRHHDGHGPKGNHKGKPPRKGVPEQTRTLEEIGGYQLGDLAADFTLKNIDGKMVSLSDVKDAKGYIVVFTCNECPFAKMYEDRLIALHSKYSSMGYPVIAINSNAGVNTDENFEAMQMRAREKSFPFVYLADENYQVSPLFGAVRTPHVFLLDADRKVQYIGTIDNNAKHAADVTVKYVEDAIAALEKGEQPNPNFTKAIGCPVKAH